MLATANDTTTNSAQRGVIAKMYKQAKNRKAPCVRQYNKARVLNVNRFVFYFTFLTHHITLSSTLISKSVCAHPVTNQQQQQQLNILSHISAGDLPTWRQRQRRHQHRSRFVL